MMKRDIVPAGGATGEGDPTLPYDMAARGPEMPDLEQPEDAETAAAKSAKDEWLFWDRNITAALTNERRFRQEALASEKLYFGPDEDPGDQEAEEATKSNTINDKVGLVHANVEVLKPLLYSDTPQPIVRRRFMGDGKKTDFTDLMVAEAAQRVATYLLDTEDFDGAMERARDDWLIAGRGVARIYYKAKFKPVPVIDEVSGQPKVDPVSRQPVMQEAKVDERVCPKGMEWRRVIFAATESWDTLPWMAFEIPMTRSAIINRFGAEIAGRMSFNNKGLIDQSRGIGDSDRDGRTTRLTSETGEPAVSPFDTAMVMEIWNREDRTVVWWSSAYTDGILDKDKDPLELENFWPMPKPLLATVRGDRLTPRPDIRYYEDRAEEVRIASTKLKAILKVLSVSGLFPGQMEEEVKKLLQGDSVMIPVQSWLKLMDKGGTANIIQWLPIEAMMQAAQALVLMREQAKQAMYEASGISDIMRSAGDPNETATAQNLKGKYAGLRMSSRQRRMAYFARDTLRLMLEVAVEQFDTAHLALITGIDLPMTEAERKAMIAQNDLMTQAFTEAMAQHQAQQQQVQQVAQAAQQAGPEMQQRAAPVIQGAAQAIGQPPQPPQLIEVPETSWEMVHARLRSDLGRKISITIETQSTILADEAEDKQTRVEFINAFAGFVAALAPMMGSGFVDLKMVKELLLFGVRGFPKSRTIETMIASLPDEMPPKEEQEPVQVTVANIKGEVDRMIEEMRLADAERERQHETRLKGIELIAEGQRMKAEAMKDPPPEGPKEEENADA